MIGVESSGSFDNIEAALTRMTKGDIFASLRRFGEEGVSALASATPEDSGLTADSWTYEIVQNSKSYSIIWGNTNVVDGTPVAVLIQVGHGTRNGGYVEGVDYINPALRPIFDRIVADVWKAVTSA